MVALFLDCTLLSCGVEKRRQSAPTKFQVDHQPVYERRRPSHAVEQSFQRWSVWEVIAFLMNAEAGSRDDATAFFDDEVLSMLVMGIEPTVAAVRRIARPFAIGLPRPNAQPPNLLQQVVGERAVGEGQALHPNALPGLNGHAAFLAAAMRRGPWPHPPHSARRLIPKIGDASRPSGGVGGFRPAVQGVSQQIADEADELAKSGHAQLGVDGLGLRADGAGGDGALLGDLRRRQALIE